MTFAGRSFGKAMELNTFPYAPGGAGILLSTPETPARHLQSELSTHVQPGQKMPADLQSRVSLIPGLNGIEKIAK